MAHGGLPIDLNLTVQPQFVDYVQSTTTNSVNINPGCIVRNIIVAERWSHTNLISELKKTTTTTFADDCGVVDFYPSPDSAVMYLTVDDILSSSSGTKRKLVKLRNVKSVTGIVIAEYNRFIDEQFNSLQKFAVLDLGLKTVLPVSNQQEAALYLSQMVSVSNGLSSNPFNINKPKTPSLTIVLNALQCIPGIGETKAKRLLDRFGSLKKICDADVDEL